MVLGLSAHMQHRQGERSLFPPCQQVRQDWAHRVAPLCFCNVPAQDVLPAWMSLLTTGFLGFLLSWPRFCLENTDPRMRGRGIQLLSQVLLQCYSLLQEKEGKGCSGP